MQKLGFAPQLLFSFFFTHEQIDAWVLERNAHLACSRVMSSSRKKRACLPTSVACGLILVPLVLYLTSILAFHASFLSPSSLDSMPMALVRHRPQARKVVEDDVKSKKSCIAGDEGCGAQNSENSISQQAVNVTKLWNPWNFRPAYEQRQQEEGLDLSEILNYLPHKRRQWLKIHWSEVKILHSDHISEEFPTRIKSFFNSTSSSLRRCSTRFFMTWISPLTDFGSRELVCLLSIFKQHPSACVVIISRSLDNSLGREVLRPLVDAGYRVVALAPDLPFLFNNTPAQSWLKSLKKGRVDPGEVSFRQNLSNILRLVALYKYGGIYLDSDVIILRSVAPLRNTIGAQSGNLVTGEWYRLNNAVLVFDKQHPVLRSFIKEFALTFNGSKWGHNGPYLATRVLKRSAKQQQQPGCTVLAAKDFYPVDWKHIAKLFASPKDEKAELWRDAKVEVLLNRSYAIHLWNRESRGLRVENGSVIHTIFRWVLSGTGFVLPDEDDDDNLRHHPVA